MTAGKLPEAEQQFKRALEIDPNYSDARYNLASAEATNGEWKAAAENYEQVTVGEAGQRESASTSRRSTVSMGGRPGESGRQPARRLRTIAKRWHFVLTTLNCTPAWVAALARMNRLVEALARGPRRQCASIPPFQPAKQALQAMQAQ